MEKNRDWEAIVKKTIAQTREEFKEIIMWFSDGAYIEPEHYFVVYIFETDAELEAAKASGLKEKIVAFHLNKLEENGYPKDGIKTCYFNTEETRKREGFKNWMLFYK